MKPSLIRTVCTIGTGVAVLVLAGCAGDQDELQQWMEQQKREVKPSVEPLSAPKKFIPQAYVALSSVEPFSTQKLTVALKQEARQPNSLLAAEINRRKEALEAYLKIDPNGPKAAEVKQSLPALQGMLKK